jgi:NADH-quinone oxidoreductase subunit L
MLTAFYMTRLMIMTFHGENRTGEQERRHLHEVPAVMWVPLAVLAALSVAGGWLNVPEAIKDLPVLGWIPSTAWVHEWLHPQLAVADEIIASHVGEVAHQSPFGGGEAFWAMLSFALATAVIVLSTLLLRRRRVVAARVSPEPTGFARVLYRKWYVDEIYDALVVRPVLAVSRFFWRYLDQGLIDGVVNGAGYSARAFGWVGAQLQTGQLNTYAFAAVLGVLLLLGFVIF